MAKQHRWNLAAHAGVIGISAVLGAPVLAQFTTLNTPHPEQDGGFATSIASVPDVDGDGKADVVVGAFNETVGQAPAAGRVYIYSGATGKRLRALQSPAPLFAAWFGYAVAGVPDVNADGRGDVIVGVPNDLNGGPMHPGPGRAHIFSGATGALIRTIPSPHPEAQGLFGFAVEGLADVTGDGCGEVVVGAYAEDPGAVPDGAGRAYLFNGKTGAKIKTLFAPVQQEEAGFGFSLAAVPDASGDGLPDIAVGAIAERTGGSIVAGRVYLFSGSNGTFLRTLDSPSPENDGLFGFRISGVPDVNGDGRGDVIVGAHGESPGAAPERSGRAHLYSGATGVRLRTFAAGHQESDDEFGIDIAGLADMNGDGRGDILIGAPGMDPGADPADCGRILVYSGATGAFLKSIASPNKQFLGRFGEAVAGIADLNANGKGDMLAGAPDEDTTEPVSGLAYIVRN